MSDLYSIIIAIMVYWSTALVFATFLKKRNKNLQVTPLMIVYKARTSLESVLKIKNRKIGKYILFIGIALNFVSLFFFYYIIIGVVLAKFAGTAEGGLVPIIPGITIKGVTIIYILVAIGIAATIHELAHAYASHLSGVKVKGAGFILAVFIPAAFVEPDEESFTKARLIDKLKILSAGPASNLALGILFFLILMFINLNSTGAMIVGVENNSLAQNYGLQPGYVILYINQSEIKSPYDIAPIIQKYSNLSVVFNITYVEPISKTLKSIIIVKPENISRIGITVIQPKAISYIPDFIYFPLMDIIFYLYMINFSLAILNSAPIFITDGGRIVSELLLAKFPGNKGKALNFFIQIFSLLLILSSLTLTPIG